MFIPAGPALNPARYVLFIIDLVNEFNNDESVKSLNVCITGKQRPKRNGGLWLFVFMQGLCGFLVNLHKYY